MIRVGIAGIGFMGMIHYLTYQKLRGINVVALCEQNEKRLTGDWRDIKGNFGPPGAQVDLSGIRTYTELDDLLQDDQVDVVDITLPPSLHADVAIKAFARGKHVFSEKPMAMSPKDCDRMVKAADQASCQLYVGHVLPFFPEYAWALTAARSGKYGSLRGATFKRVISDPQWLWHYWSPDVIGGPMLDLHIHDAHFIRLLFGMPQGVITRGSSRAGLPEYWHSFFDYGKEGPTVLATSGTIDQQGRAFCHGFEIQFEKVTLLFEFAVIGGEARYLCEPTILDARGNAKPAKLAGGDPMDSFARELREVQNCLRQNRPSDVLGSDLARDAIILCQKQSESLSKHRAVRI